MNKGRNALAAIFIIVFIAGIVTTLVVWGIIASQSPQGVAEGRGLTRGFLGATSSDGSFIVIFDNESLGRKHLVVRPSDVKNKNDLVFIQGDEEYVALYFEKNGVRDCQDLTDEQLVDKYLLRVEIYYK